ncbi:GMC oxidoreductase [Cognatiyoonia sp. IB215446]|uniref:GMC oxidoreductase n=1 Tax=Cognatiyoonia sp. IB215446 TaxID=3097355 RepID=UPI002A0B5CCE|nr:GMC oxidoreductase [Cognatiyoonia sp. IB215446]MDX8348122.1 GMC oxidoreductase [Cognatiyoonia sp. IB215446]
MWTGVLCRLDVCSAIGDVFARTALDPFYDQAEDWLGASVSAAPKGDYHPMAMARPHGPTGPVAGPADIVSRASEMPEIRSCRARRFVHSGGQVTSVEVVDVSTGEIEQLYASQVVVAADPLRSAALLHASGLSAEDGFPVGQYLSDHPLAAARLSDLSPDGYMVYDAITDGGLKMGAACLSAAPAGVHALILAPPAAHGPANLALYWYMTAEPNVGNRLCFDTTPDEVTGLWGGRVDMANAVASEDDLSVMLKHLKATCDHLGVARGMGTPRLLPLGAASHAFGTLRSGAVGQGVTDLCGRVHGMRNLWVAGTARFPAPNARNPMLAAVAMAIGTARAVAGDQDCVID